MSPQHAQYVFMGTITKPHGIRGEMALHTSAETPKVLLGKAFLAPPAQVQSAQAQSAQAQSAQAQSARAHHDNARQDKFQPSQARPSQVQQTKVQQTKAQQTKAQLGKAQSSLSQSTLSQSSLTTSSGTASSGDAELPPQARPITIANVRIHHQTVLITIEGITDRTGAESLRRHRIFIDRQKLPALGDDDYYQTDLLGLDVFVHTLEDENYLGELTHIDAPAGQEIWTITSDEDQEILLPAVPQFVSIIDLDEEYIIITPPPGLIELYTNSGSSKDG